MGSHQSPGWIAGRPRNIGTRFAPVILGVALASLLAFTAGAVTASAGTAALSATHAVSPSERSWSPLDPPSDLQVFERDIARSLVLVSCGDASAQGWSSVYDYITNESIIRSDNLALQPCSRSGGDVTVSQGEKTWTGKIVGGSFPATVTINGFVQPVASFRAPTPVAGQWVAWFAAPSGSAMRADEVVDVARRPLGGGTTLFDVLALSSSPLEADMRVPVFDSAGRVLGLTLNLGGSTLEALRLGTWTDDPRPPSMARDFKIVKADGPTLTVAWKSVVDPGGTGGPDDPYASNTVYYGVGTHPVSTYCNVSEGQENICTLSGLTVGVPYRVYISATNGYGSVVYSFLPEEYVPTPPTPTKFVTCKTMRLHYPYGVSRSTAAQRTAVIAGMHPPDVQPKVYRQSAPKLDRDRNGSMCEVRR